MIKLITKQHTNIKLLSTAVLFIGLALVANTANAQCQANIDFGSDATALSSSSQPTITGIPLPTNISDASNKYYVDNSYLNFTTYSSLSSNHANPLAINYSDTANAENTGILQFIEPADLTAFNGANAAHPLSNNTASRNQANLTYPSHFTETTAGSTSVKHYFLTTNIHYDATATNENDTIQSNIGVQTLATGTNVINANNEAMGTVGGMFYRYRDGTTAKYTTDNWSNWTRLDNRELDAQFARIDHLKLDENILTVDARTAFSLNEPVTTATEKQTTEANIALKIAAKDAGSIYFGSHNNNQYATAGASNFVFNLTSGGTNQTISSLDDSQPLKFITNSRVFDFSGNNITNVATAQLDNITFDTNSVFHIGNLKFQGNSIAPTNSGSITINASTTNSVTFANSHINEINKLIVDAITIESNSLHNTNVASSLVLKSASTTTEFSYNDISNAGGLLVGNNMLLYGTAVATISTVAGSLTIAASIVDFDVNNITNVGTITAKLIENETLVLGNIKIEGNTISSTAGNIEIDAANKAIAFADDSLFANINQIAVGNTLLADNVVSAISNSNMVFDAASSTIEFSDQNLIDIASLKITNSNSTRTTISNNTITNSSATEPLIFNSSNDNITFADQHIDARTLEIGNNLVINNPDAEADNDLITNGSVSNTIVAINDSSLVLSAVATGKIGFSNSTVTHIRDIKVGNDTIIDKNGIRDNSNNITLKADKIILVANGNTPNSTTGAINLNNMPTVNYPNINFSPLLATTSYGDNDAALNKHDIDNRISLSFFNAADDKLDANYQQITNVAPPINNADAANKQYIDTKFKANLGIAENEGVKINLDYNNYRISNLGVPEQDNDLATKEYVDQKNGFASVLINLGAVRSGLITMSNLVTSAANQYRITGGNKQLQVLQSGMYEIISLNYCVWGGNYINIYAKDASNNRTNRLNTRMSAHEYYHSAQSGFYSQSGSNGNGTSFGWYPFPLHNILAVLEKDDKIIIESTTASSTQSNSRCRFLVKRHEIPQYNAL